MDVAEFVRGAFERGDLFGLAAALAVVVLGTYLKLKPVEKPCDKPGTALVPVETDNGLKLDKVSNRIETIDKRLARVENDIEHLPTQKDLHEMEVKMARVSERMISIERTTESTGRAVGRIEDFMISMKRTD